jgi:eukaryotic-like serine/threonine-protein kinase
MKPPPSDSLLDDKVSFGKYQFLARIGKGGMANVYLARPKAQKRLVAIKLILDKLLGTKNYVDMFIQEGKLAVQLNHDAIVKTYEVGRIKGRHFICMEYISGVDLSVLLRRVRATTTRRLPVPHVLYIALRICEGLHYAHELKDSKGRYLNLVNRDVSPSNVRLSFEGDVKLLDFGIAKAKSSLSSEIGVLKGKLSHMSPEQIRGMPLDRRSDVFATGIVLHEMLTLEKLFRADSEFKMMDTVGKAEVKPPSALNKRVDAEVDAIVLRALEKAPNARYQTAEEMAQELRRVLERYDFSRAELRELVRDAGSEEWEKEQRTLEAQLSDAVVAQEAALEIDEEYGLMLEVSVDEALEELPAPAPWGIPPWMWGLLGAAVVLLGLAVVLIVVL